MNPDVQVERGLPLALEERDHKRDSSEDVTIIVSPDAMVKYDEKEIHPGLPADPPDGGLRAWSVVIGVGTTHFIHNAILSIAATRLC